MRKHDETGIQAKYTSSSEVGVSRQASEPKLRLAYLVNQYPKVSHSFIRREIIALEQLGWQIYRLSLRGWDAKLVDPEDILEQGKTAFVLKAGALKLLVAMVAIAARSPN